MLFAFDGSGSLIVSIHIISVIYCFLFIFPMTEPHKFDFAIYKKSNETIIRSNLLPSWQRYLHNWLILFYHLLDQYNSSISSDFSHAYPERWPQGQKFRDQKRNGMSFGKSLHRNQRKCSSHFRCIWFSCFNTTAREVVLKTIPDLVGFRCTVVIVLHFVHVSH